MHMNAYYYVSDRRRPVPLLLLVTQLSDFSLENKLMVCTNIIQLYTYVSIEKINIDSKINFESLFVYTVI